MRTSMMLRTGKTCLAVTAFLAALSLTGTGCNFFGKQTDAPVNATGVLGDGSSIIGTWSTSVSDVSSTGNPTYAVTQTFTFDPNGGARIEARDLHLSGGSCVWYGQYRSVGARDVIVYIQAASSSNCGAAAQLHLADVKVLAKSLEYTDPGTNQHYSYFADNAQSLAPVGVWNFGGQGGIDYLFLDPHGYFILQTTDTGTQYLFLGLYSIGAGALTLTFMADMDPTHTLSPPAVFSSFAVVGNNLVLQEETDSGPTTYTGARQ